MEKSFEINLYEVSQEDYQKILEELQVLSQPPAPAPAPQPTQSRVIFLPSPVDPSKLTISKQGIGTMKVPEPLKIILHPNFKPPMYEQLPRPSGVPSLLSAQNPPQNPGLLEFENRKKDKKYITINQSLIRVSKYTIPTEKVTFSEADLELNFKDIKNFIAFLYSGRISIPLEPSTKFYQIFLLSLKFQVSVLVEYYLDHKYEEQIAKSSSFKILVNIMQSDYFQKNYFEPNKLEARVFIKHGLALNLDNILQAEDTNKTGVFIEGFRLMQLKTFEQILDLLQEMNIATWKIRDFFRLGLKYYEGDKESLQNSYIEKMKDKETLKDLDTLITSRTFATVMKLCKAEDSIWAEAYHFQRSAICDELKESFVAKCGHRVCKYCLCQYFCSKSRSASLNFVICSKYKIRCLARQVDPDLCMRQYSKQDLEQLKGFVKDEVLNLYGE